jgi:hypothetical protein
LDRDQPGFRKQGDDILIVYDVPCIERGDYGEQYYVIETLKKIEANHATLSAHRKHPSRRYQLQWNRFGRSDFGWPFVENFRGLSLIILDLCWLCFHRTDLCQLFSDPCGTPPAIENPLYKHTVGFDTIVDGERKSLGQEAIILFETNGMDTRVDDE